MTEAEVLALLDECSNAGRWGAEDEIGTLNLITPEKRLEAAALVRSGLVISIAHDLSAVQSPANPDPLVHRMHLVAYSTPGACLDSVLITTHGFSVTHMDALGHVNFRGRMYNDREAGDAITPQGLARCSVLAMKDGVFTRGVVLDVARARGVDWLELDDEVGSGDLDTAAEQAGVTIAPGDAIFVRVGLRAREAALGADDPMRRPGLAPDAIRWIHAHDIALYSGDCVERMPSGYETIPLPLHQIGLPAMGLAMLDNADMERLAATARDQGRAEFLFVCAPLPIPGGTGSAVNPLAVF